MPANGRQDETRIASAPPLERGEPTPVDENDFRQRFGEDLRQVLDVNTWHTGKDLTQEYPRIQREVNESVEREGELQRRVRADIFPQLFNPATAPAEGGVYQANMDALGVVHRGLLFNGGVEACDGTVQVYDTLPLTVYQIGVSLVSYRGDQGTWHQRLFRRDLRQEDNNPLDEVIQALAQRSQRAALNHSSQGDVLGELARKAVMDYAERAILARRCDAVWRMGHGNPITYELLTGGGILELMVAATRVLRELIETHRRFVFVASEPRELALLTIGQALPPLHYAVVYNLAERLRDWIHQRRFAVGVTAKAIASKPRPHCSRGG